MNGRKIKDLVRFSRVKEQKTITVTSAFFSSAFAFIFTNLNYVIISKLAVLFLSSLQMIRLSRVVGIPLSRQWQATISPLKLTRFLTLLQARGVWHKGFEDEAAATALAKEIDELVAQRREQPKLENQSKIHNEKKLKRLLEEYEELTGEPHV